MKRRRKRPSKDRGPCVVCGVDAVVRGWNGTGIRLPMCCDHDTEAPRRVIEGLIGRKKPVRAKEAA